MGRIKIKITKTYRKSDTTTDKNGQLHCKTCGAFISGRGKKETGGSNKTGIYKRRDKRNKRKNLFN